MVLFIASILISAIGILRRLGRKSQNSALKKET
jgi:hypothetical protein